MAFAWEPDFKPISASENSFEINFLKSKNPQSTKQSTFALLWSVESNQVYLQSWTTFDLTQLKFKFIKLVLKLKQPLKCLYKYNVECYFNIGPYILAFINLARHGK